MNLIACPDCRRHIKVGANVDSCPFCETKLSGPFNDTLGESGESRRGFLIGGAVALIGGAAVAAVSVVSNRPSVGPELLSPIRPDPVPVYGGPPPEEMDLVVIRTHPAGITILDVQTHAELGNSPVTLARRGRNKVLQFEHKGQTTTRELPHDLELAEFEFDLRDWIAQVEADGPDSGPNTGKSE